MNPAPNDSRPLSGPANGMPAGFTPSPNGWVLSLSGKVEQHTVPKSIRSKPSSYYRPIDPPITKLNLNIYLDRCVYCGRYDSLTKDSCSPIFMNNAGSNVTVTACKSCVRIISHREYSEFLDRFNRARHSIDSSKDNRKRLRKAIWTESELSQLTGNLQGEVRRLAELNEIAAESLEWIGTLEFKMCKQSIRSQIDDSRNKSVKDFFFSFLK